MFSDSSKRVFRGSGALRSEALVLLAGKVWLGGSSEGSSHDELCRVLFAQVVSAPPFIEVCGKLGGSGRPLAGAAVSGLGTLDSIAASTFEARHASLEKALLL